MTESDSERRRRQLREAKEAAAARDRSAYEKRIGDRLEQEARREVQDRRELEDFVGEHLGASVDEIQRAFDKGAPPDAQIMRDFSKIKRAKGARRKRLVRGGPGRRVRKAYAKRRGCRIWALAILAGAGATLTTAAWGAYEMVRWAL